MLVRTSSGSTSVGHLSHSPHGFSSLWRPDTSLSCGCLIFPVHSLLLSVSSRFWADFFSFIRQGGCASCGVPTGPQAPLPEVIPLEGGRLPASLNSTSLSYYLDFVYTGGMLPEFDTVGDSVELLRLAAFFGNAALVAQLHCHLSGRLEGLSEEALLLVFRAAVDLKLRRLATDCLVLVLPQFGRAASEGTVGAAVEAMDVVLSKTLLAQLLMQGAASLVPSSPGSSAAGDGPGSTASSPEAVTTPGRCPSSGGSSCFLGAAGAAPKEMERIKAQFVKVLEARGWGSD